LAAVPRSSIIWLPRRVEGHDPYCRGHSSPSVWMAFESKPSSWIPPRSGWGHTCVLSGRIWPVVIVPIVTALDDIVLSVRLGTGMASDQTEVTAISSVLARSVQRAGSCQRRHACRRSISLRSFQGSWRGRGRAPFQRRAAKAGRRGHI
jgi:hypothetical protein